MDEDPVAGLDGGALDERGVAGRGGDEEAGGGAEGPAVGDGEEGGVAGADARGEGALGGAEDARPGGEAAAGGGDEDGAGELGAGDPREGCVEMSEGPLMDIKNMLTGLCLIFALDL